MGKGKGWGKGREKGNRVKDRKWSLNILKGILKKRKRKGGNSESIREEQKGKEKGKGLKEKGRGIFG